MLIGGTLVMLILESAGIAVDQWYGHAADPASPVASAVLTPAFGVLALIGLVPAWYLFRSLRGQARRGHGRLSSRIPVAEHRSWPAWILGGMFLLVGAAGVFGGISLVRDGFGMPLSWLHQTPFTGWALPGIALLIGVAVPQFMALGLIVSGHRWALAAATWRAWGWCCGSRSRCWCCSGTPSCSRPSPPPGPRRCCWPGCGSGRKQRRAGHLPRWHTVPLTDPAVGRPVSIRKIVISGSSTARD